MLRIGLTGGIGSGKSTVSGLLAAHGAMVVDSDRIAREVVEPGTPGLAAVRERFGPGVVTPDGVLDRAALGAIVFADPASRRALEAITHPLIRARTVQLVEAAPPGTIVVHDIPLLVEIGAAPTYHLVVVVDVDAEERIRRLVTSRGMGEADARSRVANQASRQERMAAADVVVDNNGAPEALVPQVDRLWQRLTEFDRRLRSGDPLTGPTPVVPPDPTWPAQADRAIARLVHRLVPVLGREPAPEHVGPTAVPGLSAPDVLHLRVGLAPGEADRPEVRTALAELGLPADPRVSGTRTERAGAEEEPLHLSCDPGRRAQVRLHTLGSARARTALMARDWLRAVPSARRELAEALEADPASEAGGDLRATGPEDPEGFPAGWWAAARVRAESWATDTGWHGARP